MRKVFEAISLIFKIVTVFVSVWFILSYIDVLIHNTNLDGGTILATWNFFAILMR